MTPPELAVSIVSPAPLGWLRANAAARATQWERLIQDAPLASWLGSLEPTHLYFGSEFCEHLLPTPSALEGALDLAQEHALTFVLLTPIASPGALRQLSTLLRALPSSAQVVVNDWGVAHLIAEQAPHLERLAGRILCRMIKDPRLGSADWAAQCSHSLDSPHLRAIFQRLGLEHFEIDVPLFAESSDFTRLPMRKSVHIPYGFVAKGRMCRPGSLSITGPERFAVGRTCHKECLTITASTARPGTSDQRETVHVGNTIFSRHTSEMTAAVMAATDAGAVQRLIVPGETF